MTLINLSMNESFNKISTEFKDKIIVISYK